ncbi:Pirin [Carpediemonas membranifera]|uniref:Pirin n=1 Tax=Carpediemonas membranifera TaxID=201153 RepID=A0A8J6AQS4_9EUKA|nr:Pirin [Carpediemonas membranifera]|eukprot:KAG9391831.1 Pirin [Carpediemonas membranifera]
MLQVLRNIARPFIAVTNGVLTSDGAGVSLRRMLGAGSVGSLDPLLMLDAFGSDKPQDYIAGFPPHPHRGFETVTYLTAGRMRHKDNAGHEGVIEQGGVQWMTAGRGIIHSEMPEQRDGLLAGFQLWINLPAVSKMTPPAYQEFTAAQIPVEVRDGMSTKVIAGTTDNGTEGVVKQIATQPLYVDVTLDPNAVYAQTVPEGHAGFVHVIEGSLVNHAGKGLERGQLAVLGDGDHASLRAGDSGARFLLVSGRSLNEPVAWRGPIVMNTQEELYQAFEDYQSGKF